MYPRPNTVKQLRSWLGLASYYRRFIKGFAQIAAPLNDLTKGNQSSNVKLKEWTKEHEQAFQELKKKIINAPVLAIFDENAETVIETDASTISVAGVLSQIGKDGIKRPIGFFSRKLSDTEKKYAPIDLELLAIQDTILYFKNYVYGIEFKVYSDHKPLMYLKSARNLSNRLVRLLTRLADFTFSISYLKGSSNTVPDSLSRIEIEDEKKDENSIYIRSVIKKETLELLTKDLGEEIDIRQAQADDKFCTAIMKAKAGDRDWKGYSKTERKRYERKARRFIIDKEGIIRYKTKNQIGETIQPVVVPEKLEEKILRTAHESPLGGGHFAEKKTLQKIQNSWWFERITSKVANHCKTCDSCQRTKRRYGKTPGLLKPIEVEECAILSHLIFDYIGPFNKSQGKSYILNVTDKATGYSFCEAVASANGETTVKFLYSIIASHGVPKVISTDGGSHFKNELFRETCNGLGITLKHSTSYSASTQGACERRNQIIVSALTHYANAERNNWSDLVKFIAFSYNITPLTEFKGLSPYFLVYGAEPNLYLFIISSK